MSSSIPKLVRTYDRRPFHFFGFGEGSGLFKEDQSCWLSFPSDSDPEGTDDPSKTASTPFNFK